MHVAQVSIVAQLHERKSCMLSSALEVQSRLSVAHTVRYQNTCGGLLGKHSRRGKVGTGGWQGTARD